MCEKAKYGVCTNHYSDVTCIKLLFQLYIHSSIHLSVRPSPIIISQKAVGQLFRTSLGGAGNEKEKLSILTGKRKMTCACEFLKVYLFRMMTISDIQSKTGKLQVQLGLLCNFDHVVVNYVDVNVNVKLPA